MSELPPGGEVSMLQAGSGVSVCALLIELRSVVSKVKDQTMALQELNSQDYWSDRVLNNIQNLHRKCKQHKFDHQGYIIYISSM